MASTPSSLDRIWLTADALVTEPLSDDAERLRKTASISSITITWSEHFEASPPQALNSASASSKRPLMSFSLPPVVYYVDVQ